MVFKFVLWMILAPSLMFGFRIIPSFIAWDVDNSVTANRKVFLSFENGSTSIENDLEAGDPLYGTATVTIAQVMNSIMDDYNNIAGAYITVVDTNDSDYATRGDNRTITIEDGAAIGLTSGGYARPFLENGRMVGCQIVLNPEFYEKASLLVRGVTHELGHCLGLNHAMDTVHAVMSYYYLHEPTTRLQIDDKMGMVYLYPVDASAAKEQATFGFACSRVK